MNHGTSYRLNYFYQRWSAPVFSRSIYFSNATLRFELMLQNMFKNMHEWRVTIKNTNSKWRSFKPYHEFEWKNKEEIKVDVDFTCKINPLYFIDFHLSHSVLLISVVHFLLFTEQAKEKVELFSERKKEAAPAPKSELPISGH